MGDKIKVFIKDYLSSAMSPASEIDAYANRGRVPCRVFYADTKHRGLASETLRTYSHGI